MRVLLIRHGETAMNLERIVQGPVLDAPLNDTGRAQARALSEHLRAEKLEAVYSSPLARARATADAIAAATRAPLHIEPSLVELHWGAYCGVREEGAVALGMRDTLARWVAGEVDHAPPGGESPAQAARRVAPFFDALAERHPDDASVAVVAHGRVNRVILSHLLDRDLRRMQEYPQSNTAVSELHGPAPTWKLARLNDVSHLDGVLAPPDPAGSSA